MVQAKCQRWRPNVAKRKDVTKRNSDVVDTSRPGGRGGRIRSGNPGNKGGGDKPKAYKLWLASLLDSQKHREEFARAIEDRSDPAFMAATRHAAEFAHGKPAQRVEVEDTTPAKPVTLDAALEKLSLMARTMKALGTGPVEAIPEAEVEELDE